MGNVYYDLTDRGARFEVPMDGKVIIKPGHRVVLITHEEIDVPNDVLARVVSKGSLFSVGLSAVATYADPGFRGRMGIVTQNISDKYIVLPLREPIAKIDFTRLSGPVLRPYRGQHGFDTEIWPIKTHLQKTHAEVAGDGRVRSEKEEAYALLPQATAQILRNMEHRNRTTNIAIVVATFINALALASATTRFFDNVISLGISLAASVIALGVTFFGGRKS